MLTYSIKKLMESKGIRSKISYFESKGFSYHTSRKFVSDDMGRIRLSTLEKLCIALDCTPNDLLTYVPGTEPLAADHPLHTLNEERYNNEIIERLKLLNTVELAHIKEQLRLVLEQKNNAK